MLHLFKNTKPNQLLTNIRLVTSYAKKVDHSSEVFGTLSERGKQALAVSELDRFYPDDEDGYDKEEFDLTPRKNDYYYKYEITKYARQGSVGLRKALELFSDMKSKDRLTPTIYNFSPLIYGCAQAGYTKKAFDLYKESLNYYKKPSKSMITCLINSCGESPFKEYAIKKLDWFREHLKFEYNYKLNDIQYRSAIKSYGKLGELEKASQLVKEMIENQILPDTQTFNMLLIGCASDKESGATIALRLFKRMRYYNLKPDIITFRLMLRCIRDCEFGSAELLEKTIGELPVLTNYNQKIRYKNLLSKQTSSNKKGSNELVNFVWLPLITDLGDCITSATNKTSEQANIRLLNAGSNDNSDIIPISSCDNNSLYRSDYNYQLSGLSNKLPNLLSDDHLELMERIKGIQFGKLKLSSGRLLLFGGLHGYLETMTKEGCRPDSKTFSLLLGCIRHEKNVQLEYLRLAKDYKIKRDLLFYDLLIRHICSNANDSTRLQRALDLLDEMHIDQIRPNITTFESLALGCDTWLEAKKLVDDVERCGFTISHNMIKRFFKTATYKSDYRYLLKLINLSIDKNYEPTKNLVESLEKFRIQNRELIVKYEKGISNDEEKPVWLDDKFIKLHDKFSLRWKSWLKSVNIQTEEHPWSQFYVESTAKRMGYRNFVDQFKKLEELKQEALSTGTNFGNLAKKAGIDGCDLDRKDS